jgi:uracil-DNA glycosylase family 4
MIAQKPKNCRGCVLEQLGRGFMQVEGSGVNHVMIVGEAAGTTEVSESLPFRPTAEAGSLLENCLRKGGYDRQSFTINNIVRCGPPNNKLDGVDYEQEAIAHCSSYFDRSITRFQPRCLLALGNIPLRNLTGYVGEKQGISLVRGFVLNNTKYDLPVVSSFHPSYINRGNKHLKGILIRDIGLAIEVAAMSAGQIAEKRQLEEIAKSYYILNPSISEAWGWANTAINSGLAIAYDIETPYSEVEDDESELDPNAIGQRVTQIQFSIGSSTIVFPWTQEFKEVAAYILASNNDKWGWNNYLFDDPILRKEGLIINGTIHDLMLAWHFLQPDLPKGLQFVTSFYSPWFGPWKHLSGADLALYGAKDGDATYRCGLGIMRDLKQDKLYDSYYKYYVRLHPILAEASKRGIPIDATQQTALRVELEKKMAIIDEQARPMVPDSILDVHPKQGYKKVPKEILLLSDAVGKSLNTDKPMIMSQASRQIGFDNRKLGGEFRWCRLIPFNINSGAQLIRYIEFKQQTNKLYKVPIKRGTSKKTVEELALQRLYNKTKDPVLALALERKKMQHFVSSFCSAAWTPGEDGKVHPTFKVGGTNNGQLAAENPNSQQWPKHGPLAKEARKLILAPPGFKIVKLDYKSYHAQTAAAEAGDANYLRLAKLDLHSYVTGHFLKLAGKDEWLDLPDPELKPILAKIKTEHKHVRDAKVKHAILGINNGMGVGKLYDIYQEFFDNKKEAAAILSLLRQLFPIFFKWQDDVRRVAHRDGFLRSKYNCIRYFWEVFKKQNGQWYGGESSEECIAYLLANHAHCHLKDRMIEMDELGYLERYNLVNIIHDEIDLICADELVEECITNLTTIMERPSEVMVYPICLEGLSIEVDVEVGQNWSAYHPVGNPEGMRGR